MIDIAVVDYGMGNLRSVYKALRFVAPERDIEISGDPDLIADAVRAVVLWQGIASGSRVYFAHSYHPVPMDLDLTMATVDYGSPFTCAVGRANIFAVQFHPEKSHTAGLQLLANFVAWNGHP